MKRHKFQWYSLTRGFTGLYTEWAAYWTHGRSRRRPLCVICRLDMHATAHRRVR